MFRTARTGTLRRLKLEDIIVKLMQIEQQAAMTLKEHPHGLTLERQRLILGLTKQLRSHLEDQVRSGPRKPMVAVLHTRPGQPNKLAR
jgi:hypothetical protein